MGLPYVLHYFCDAKREALFAKAPFSRATQRGLRDSPMVFRSPQAGAPGPSFHSRAKIAFVVRLKELYSDDAFVRDCPVNLAFFDTWFTIRLVGGQFTGGDVARYASPALLDDPRTDAEARGLIEMWLRHRDRDANTWNAVVDELIRLRDERESGRISEGSFHIQIEWLLVQFT